MKNWKWIWLGPAVLMLCLMWFLSIYRLAEQFKPLENTSATHIQRLFRGTRIRIDIKIKRYIQRRRFWLIRLSSDTMYIDLMSMHLFLRSDAATEIKRVVRGHVGRRQAQLRHQEIRDSRQRSLFDYFTIQLQRCFRGYYSRKYRKDHSARRAYFKKVAEKNQEVLEMMSEYALVQVSVSIFFQITEQVGRLLESFSQPFTPSFRLISVQFKKRRKDSSTFARRICIT